MARDFKRFDAISEAKFVFNGFILFGCSAGAVGILRVRDKFLIRYFVLPGNIHGVEIMPDGVGITGKRRPFDSFFLIVHYLRLFLPSLLLRFVFSTIVLFHCNGQSPSVAVRFKVYLIFQFGKTNGNEEHNIQIAANKETLG